MTITLAALFFPGGASAGTIRLHWIERTSSPSGYPAMTFRVRSVTIRRTSWSVRASVTNRSRREISVITEPSPYLPYRFGLFVPDEQSRHGLPETLSHATTWIAAVSFAPNLPAILRRGRTWRGTFSGRGTLPRGQPISVTFGVFESPQLQSFSWTTAHAFAL